MKKIINTFKYGEKKVKQSLFLAIIAGIATIAFIALALIMSNMLCFFVAIVAGFITMSLVQTFMIAEGENPTVVGQKTLNDVNSSVIQGTQQSTSSVPVKSKKIKKNKKDNNIPSTEEQKAEYKDNLVDDSDRDKNKRKKEKKEKTAKKKIAETESKSTGETVISDKYVKSEEKEDSDINSNNKNAKVITAETAATYTKKKIKKTLHKYKVMKDHRMVIVDRCDKLHIFQTPAYVWIQDNQFHILLIEEEPRLLMVPLFRITEISYLKKQPADEDKDYSLFKKSTILTECFRPYLPDYNHSNKTNDLASYKNLYGIYQGIYFTNNSAKNLFELLGVDFFVEDKVTTSNKVNIYFKETYKANIKLRDNVLDANGYAESITNVLDDMAHSTISYNEFKDTLNLMIKNKLITDEYANHYMDVRNGIMG